jgi:thioredoxin-dependent peroxiredoxin
VCTTEACSFRDASTEFASAGATVAGISSDDVASHRRFADQHSLAFPLLSDASGALRKSFGVPRGMFGLSEGRVTYVIDKDGVIRHRFDAILRANKHVEESLQTLRSLKNSAQ